MLQLPAECNHECQEFFSSYISVFSNELSPSLPPPHSLFILVHPFLFLSLHTSLHTLILSPSMSFLSLSTNLPLCFFLRSLSCFLPLVFFILLSQYLCFFTPLSPLWTYDIYLFPSFLYLISGLFESLALSHGSLHLHLSFLVLCLSRSTFVRLLFFSVIFCCLLTSVFLSLCLSNAPCFIFLRVWLTPTRTVSCL